MANRYYIEVSFKFEQEDAFWIARCVELGISSFGATKTEAFARVKEAVLLYLDGITEYGECAGILKEAGIELLQDTDLDSYPSSDTRSFLPIECAFA